jgi:hypothetical protein
MFIDGGCVYDSFKPPVIYLLISGPSAKGILNIQLHEHLTMDIAKSLFGNRTHEGYAGKENYNVSYPSNLRD